VTRAVTQRLRTGSGRGPDGALSDRRPRARLFPLLVFAATWVLIVATWLIANGIYHSHLTWTNFLWPGDPGIYTDIAQNGYRTPVLIVPAHGLGSPFVATGKAAFFPLLPALVRLVSYATAGNFRVAALVTQLLAGAASAVAVWALAARVRDRRTADRAVLLYCAFPGAMALGTLFPEPLAVALAATCLWAVLGRRWLLAGALAGLASAADPTMIVLAPVLGIAALHAVWTRREWRSLAAPVLAPLGMLAYFAYYGHRYHDYLFWFRIERAGWRQRIDWGRTEFRLLTWSDPVVAKYAFFNGLLIVMFWAAVVGIVLLIAARAPLPVIAYTVLVFLCCVLSSGVTTKPRFVLTAVGIFIGAGAKLPRFVFWPVLIASAALLAVTVGWLPHNIPAFA
jgi:hypothetical protein